MDDQGAGRELAGLVVGVTAARRADELIGMLERHGATVLHAPALRLAPVGEDSPVVAAARRFVDAPPDVLLVTTGYGLKRWIAVATEAGFGDEFTAALGRTRLVCRGTKAKGAAIGLGFRHATGVGSTTAEVVDALVAEGITGRRIVLQAHALADQPSVDALTAAGATVEVVSPYQWVDADDGSRMPALLRAIAAREVRAVTFSAAPAVDAVLDAARHLGLEQAVVEAFAAGDVLAVAVGPVTAVPLQEVGIAPVVPDRHRTGAMVRELCRVAGPQDQPSVGPEN